jgi:tight adherence protein C
MSVSIVWPSVAAALAVASVIAIAVRPQRSQIAVPDSAPADLPPALRPAWRLSRPLRPITGRYFPTHIARRLNRQLARAGLLDSIDASDWAALLVACLLAGSAAAVLTASWSGSLYWLALAGPWLVPWLAQSWLQARAASRASTLIKQLPAAIDLLVLCLESGASLGTALKLTHDKSPPGPLQKLLAGVLQQMRAGRGRAAAFREAMEQFDLPAITGLMTALIQADARGMSLGPVLRSQSTQCVAERFVKAERAAMQAPVKLLLPLLLCIFPCTFIVIAVPIAARLTSQGGP